MKTLSADAVRQIYRDQGWGWLAESAGLDPMNTEAQTRRAFQFCWELLTDRQRQKHIRRETL